jgi:spore maturation protein CgeB
MEAPNIYRKARVVLAMNEQTLSPTMCSMRTYEAAACGNIVLSHWSQATENIFKDTVITSNSREETLAYLDDIFLGSVESPNPLYVEKAMMACDLVMQQHTYRHRLSTLIRLLLHFQKGE